METKLNWNMENNEIISLMLVAVLTFAAGIFLDSPETSQSLMTDNASASANIVASAQNSNSGELGK